MALRPCICIRGEGGHDMLRERNACEVCYVESQGKQHHTDKSSSGVNY